ncbi:MAG: ketoacyl-ACP synthase [Moraxellaceae bacterium]|jgi:3-oxoacyl-[acyl-carrier-protein] synthase-3|nr:ketoacyl-ACP synthase [Moraxellaceae bacterium]
MAAFSLSGIAVRAIAAAVPRPVERNDDYTEISAQERALLIKTTGVKERRIAPKGLTTADLCAASAGEILDRLGIAKEEIGLLVFVSQSGDYYLPASAALLQERLGLKTGTIAFDVGLGCSGYVYGLAITGSLMQTSGVKKALLLAGDVSSIVTSREDKSTYPLFGDAGSATLLENTGSGTPWHFNLMTDGSGGDAIMVPDGLNRNGVSQDSLRMKTVSEGIRRNRLNLILKGSEIFAFAVKEVPPSIHALSVHAGLAIEGLDYLVMHQANRLINETIRKKLSIPELKVPYSLDEFGNTSSASIPLTMVTRMRDRLESDTLKLLLSGFGVGLSWGNVILETTDVFCPPLLEVAADDRPLF